MKRHLPLIFLLLCVGGFALGLAQLFKLRFEGGDVYPPYSSLRLDPLGSSAFYESLQRLPDLTVQRDYSVNNQLPAEPDVAYLHLAGQRYDWEDVPEDTFKELESFLARGGRLVVAFHPETRKIEEPSFVTQVKKANAQAKKAGTKSNPAKPDRKHPSSRNEEDGEERVVHLGERWGVHFGFEALEEGSDESYAPVTVHSTNASALAPFISWHSGMVLTNLSPAWRVVYSRGTNAVVAERKFGAGTVVFATDSYFLSNEAMSRDRHADFLAWLVGPCREVVFDEAHLGITQQPGVAMLMRKYRLHGLILGLLLLAGLFIWKNSVSFAPPYADEKAEDHVAGKDSAAGFVNLLRRHVANRDVLSVCLAEWRKSFGPGQVSPAKLERVQAVVAAETALPPKDRNPVRTYQAICRALHHK